MLATFGCQDVPVVCICRHAVAAQSRAQNSHGYLCAAQSVQRLDCRGVARPDWCIFCVVLWANLHVSELHYALGRPVEFLEASMPQPASLWLAKLPMQLLLECRCSSEPGRLLESRIHAARVCEPTGTQMRSSAAHHWVKQDKSAHAGVPHSCQHAQLAALHTRRAVSARGPGGSLSANDVAAVASKQALSLCQAWRRAS